MKIQKIKNFGKKFFASIVLAIFTMGIFIPYASAQQRWQISSLNKTFFEIPSDDRNFEDFVFTNQQFQYQNWSKDEDRWISKEAKITANMMWYNHYFSPYLNANGIQKVTNQELSTFFVVVNNHYYNPEGKFAFPILSNGAIRYMHVYWKKDENEHFCLYMDFENEGKEVFKIENTCHIELYARKPFLLFFQIERTGFDIPSQERDINTSFVYDLKYPPRYKISVTTTYNTTHQNKPYVTFYKPETFHLNEENLDASTTPMINGIFNLNIQKNGYSISFVNSVASVNFLRQGNQRAFRPYSFFFEDDYNAKILKLTESAIGDMSKYNNICWTYSYYYHCQISLPVESTSWFESFVLSVAAQYYNSPAITNDNTYIEVPDPIKGEGFAPLDYENCDTLAIGCHIGNLGKTFYNTIGKFFSNIWNGFADIIKSIFSWLWDSIKNYLWPLFEPIVNFFKPLWENIAKPVWEFFWSFFEPLWQVVTGKRDGHEFWHGDQNRICELQTGYYVEHNAKWNEKPAEFFQMLFFLANPLLPDNNTQICTSLGMKQLDYGKNTLLDTTLFLIFFATGIWFSLFIIRPR